MSGRSEVPAAVAERAVRVVAALADLTPTTTAHQSGLTIPMDHFQWVAARAASLCGPSFEPSELFDPGAIATAMPLVRVHLRDEQVADLAAVDRMWPGGRALRLGWLFVAGTEAGDEGGTRRRVFVPLVSRPVKFVRSLLGGVDIVRAGDAEVTDLIRDREVRHRLEAGIADGGGSLDGCDHPDIPIGLLASLPHLRDFALAAAGAAGLHVSGLVPVQRGADEHADDEGLVVVAGCGLYAVRDTAPMFRGTSLGLWQETLSTATAFHRLYFPELAGGPDPTPSASPLDSPFLLSQGQRAALRRARDEDLVVISGAPGTGKSHSIVAIACDAVGAGRSVLVATRTDAAVDALLDLLDQAPGPSPIVFGTNERRRALADRLAEGQLEPAPDDEISRLRDRRDSAIERRDGLRADIRRDLAAEARLATQDADRAWLLEVTPWLLDPACDHESVRQLIAASRGQGAGFFARRRTAKARRQLSRLSGLAAGPIPEAAALDRALRVAAGVREATALVAGGGLDVDDRLAALSVEEREARDAIGRELSVTVRSREALNRRTLPAVAALATSLRSGRAARRAQLARIDNRLTQALPLWLGTLGDIDDLLPPSPALFDLVILDEASCIDQPLAAPALLRARSAVIVGDPHQLRHVSFVSDAAVDTVAASHALDDEPALRAVLDVRRNSTYDVAVGASPVSVLDEEFRSEPHLVSFVAERLYAGQLRIATRTPANDHRSCIEVRRAAGDRAGDGSVPAEVQLVVSELRRLAQEPGPTVGVVTPFRAQADALEKAVLGALTADEVEQLDLRVGTAHGFQGIERDVVIISMGVGDDGTAASWRFAGEPHLFTVLVTRARHRLLVVTSGDPPPGLVADFLAQAVQPPVRPAPVRRVGPWAESVADAVRAAGVEVTVAYPVGRNEVDVCAGSGLQSLGVVCEVHPDGPDAHIDRNLALREAGWDVVEAHPSRWESRLQELVVDLTLRLRGRG